MKKLSLLVGIIFLILTSAVYAEDIEVTELQTSCNGMVTTISGKVYLEETEEPVDNTWVNIYCRHNGNDNKLATMKTCPAGAFITTTLNLLPSRMCKKDDMAWVELKYNGIDYKSQEVVVREPLPHLGKATVNYGLSEVPEFSTTTLALAVMVVGLGIVVLRKK